MPQRDGTGPTGNGCCGGAGRQQGGAAKRGRGQGGRAQFPKGKGLRRLKEQGGVFDENSDAGK